MEKRKVLSLVHEASGLDFIVVVVVVAVVAVIYDCCYRCFGFTVAVVDVALVVVIVG